MYISRSHHQNGQLNPAGSHALLSFFFWSEMRRLESFSHRITSCHWAESCHYCFGSALRFACSPLSISQAVSTFLFCFLNQWKIRDPGIQKLSTCAVSVLQFSISFLTDCQTGSPRSLFSQWTCAGCPFWSPTSCADDAVFGSNSPWNKRKPFF